MSHQVLSRKYRPQGFDQLVGQAHVGRILRNALRSDRVGHAYLLVGPRGVGKTTTARIFARALNCAARTEGDAGGDRPGEGGIDPCGECPSCRDIAAGSDLDVVEMDAASNNHVEDVRRLREQVGYATVRSRYRIWIVDEVHMLSMPAFNAFLKTLEEPPEGVKFIFCTTEEHKLPDTFRSRCQRVEFRPIEAKAMAERLEALAKREGVDVEEGLCEDIASAALGGLRDAESMLEQLIAACPGEQLSRADLDALSGRAPQALLDGLRTAVAEGDAAAALDAVDATLASGCKPGVFLEQWMEGLRRDLVAGARGKGPSVARAAHSLDILLQKRMHLRAGADGTLVCQVAAVELARLPDARDLDRLIEAVRAEGKGGGTAPPPARSAPAAPAAASASAPASAPAPAPTTSTTPPASASARAPRTGKRRPAEASRRVDITAAEVAARWEQVLAAAEETDGRTAEALRRATPGQVTPEGVLDLHVPLSEAMALSTLRRRDAVLRFRDLTRDVLGTALAPRVVEEEAVAAAEPPREAMEEHPSVRFVREMTGGRLLNLEEESDETGHLPGGPGREDAEQDPESGSQA